MSASTVTVAPTPTTWTFALGRDNQVYENTGTWLSYPPRFDGWTCTT
jgi:hypothetical protein